LPAEQRFVEVSLVYKEQVSAVLESYLELVPWVIQMIIPKIASYFWWVQPEYYMELQGIATALGLDAPTLLMAQYVYEFSAFCTSVVAYDANGTIIHDRNLDFLFADAMRNITYEAHFMQNGEKLFTAVMFAGMNGVMTGHKEGFSISLNERKPSWRTNPYDLLINLIDIFSGFLQVSHVIRNTLAECSTYSCAFNKLATEPQIAPSYYALSGNDTYEGAIISRDRIGPAHIELLSADQWYIVQTNDDHWTGVCTIRCSYVKEGMDKIGRDNFTADQLVYMLKQWPSNNDHSIYNALMINS
jgi:N-acylethanolamine-hydrolysing acid amidase